MNLSHHFHIVDHEAFCDQHAPENATRYDSDKSPQDFVPECVICETPIYTQLTKTGIQWVIDTIIEVDQELTEFQQNLLETYKPQIREYMGNKLPKDFFIQASDNSPHEYHGDDQTLEESRKAGHFLKITDNVCDITTPRYSRNYHSGWYVSEYFDDVYKAGLWFCADGFFGVITATDSSMIYTSEICDCPHDAASIADGVAERLAERAMMFNLADSNGRLARAKIEEINDYRRQALCLLRSSRAMSAEMDKVRLECESYDKLSETIKFVDNMEKDAKDMMEHSREQKQDTWNEIREKMPDDEDLLDVWLDSWQTFSPR